MIMPYFSSREIEVLGEEKYAFYQELVQGVLQYKTRIPIQRNFDEMSHSTMSSICFKNIARSLIYLVHHI